MLWYKSWLETRVRFLVGLVLLLLSACGTVIAYPQISQLAPLVQGESVGGQLGQQIRESVELASTYRGYVWSQSFAKNSMQLVTLFAVLLGAGGALAQSPGRGALFILSLPVSRRQLVGVRAAIGLLELLVIAFVPSLVFLLLSPAIGQSYAIGDALVHGLCFFIASAAFYSLAVWLSSYFPDIWRPLLISCLVAVVLAMVAQLLGSPAGYSIFNVMSGEQYFRSASLPWIGLLASALISAALIVAAARSVERQDY